MHLISELTQAICSCERASEVFNSTANTLSVSLFKSVQFGHLQHTLQNRN